MRKNDVIEKFKENSVSRVSQDLFALEKTKFLFSTYGYRLIYAIAQSIDYSQDDFFPEYGFKIDAIFKYLGLENNNDRFDRLNAVLGEILKTPLLIREETKTGIYYQGYPWVTKFYYSNTEPIVYIRINEDIKPFLFNLKRYAQIRPKDYLNLSTPYQNWFYPYLKNVVKNGFWVAKIDALKISLGLDKTPSYDPSRNKNANENFLKYVLGIKISEAAKIENQLAKKEKRKAKLFAWDFVKEKNSVIGTLQAINDHTDINVTASLMKEGRSYTTIYFFLSEKNPSERKIQEAEIDMGKPQQKGKRNNKILNIGNLFPDLNNMPNPNLPKVRSFSQEEIRKHAKEMNLTQDLFIKMMRLQKGGDGKYFKED